MRPLICFCSDLMQKSTWRETDSHPEVPHARYLVTALDTRQSLQINKERMPYPLTQPRLKAGSQSQSTCPPHRAKSLELLLSSPFDLWQHRPNTFGTLLCGRQRS